MSRAGSPPHWQRAAALFEELVERTPDEQEEELASLDCEDAALADAVRELLASDQNATAEGFLASIPVGPPPRLRKIGLPRVGPYRILEELGRGGMGVVYRAARDDGQFEDEVAVKVLSSGLDAPVSRQRFLAERQILASLRHPHIAVLLDGGLADDHRPFLVMDLVDGLPIDRYCEENGLSFEDRLRLFRQVVSAVEHAHRNLVVHRDLKPSNVLVEDVGDGSARARLLDFGIAKLTDESSAELTRTGGVAFTPAYAAPEQLRGEAVTTATDVYQLGILLYRLLTGGNPHDPTTMSPSRFVEAVLSDDPEPPSRHLDSLGATQRKDLDALLLTALAKDPEARYGSARELGDDIDRILDSRPLVARPPSLAYRLGKLARRHRAAAAAVVVALGLAITVVAMGLVAVGQARRAVEERARAEDEAQKASLVADFLGEVFANADPERHQGDEPSARDLLAAGVQRIDSLRVPAARVELLEIMARAAANLGDLDEARDLARRRVNETRIDGDPASEARSLLQLADLERLANQTDTALEHVDAARTAATRLPATDPEIAAYASFVQGEIERDRGRWREAAALLAASRHLWSEAGNTDAATRAGMSLGEVRHFLGELDAAEALQREALEHFDATGRADSLEAVDARINLGMVLSAAGRPADAEPLLRSAIDGFQEAYGDDHTNIAATLSNLAIVLYRLERYAEAEELLGDSLAMRRRLLPPGHPEIANSLHNLGAVIARERPGEAEPFLREAVALRRAALGDEHVQVANSLGRLAATLEARDLIEESRPLRSEALEILEATLAADHPDVVAARRALGAIDEGRATEVRR